MPLTFTSVTSPDFVAGLRLGGKAGELNELIRDLETDPLMPALVVALVKNAYVALNTASLTLLDRAIGAAKENGAMA